MAKFLRDHKAEAAARGLDWQDVQDAFQVVREREEAKRVHADDVRKTTWELVMAGEPQNQPYWRAGFRCVWARWPKLLERDHTAVPNHDTIAQEVASYFPEYRASDGTERLFEELFAPHDPMPSREELYAMAMNLVEASQAADVVAADELPQF